ncbi:hypothetical protein CEB3_c42730 [Peptococcaceae bacterium CEB3]|nr:hypothetical protein CEB3_c42730 [Peptococcaceae bacterium CEB3]
MSENIEQMLQGEIREQKRTASGALHRASRTRRHETVRTPSENLTGFEKRLVVYPGVLHITTIGEIQLMDILERILKGEIPPRNDFDALDFKDAQKAAAELRRLHKNQEILDAWKCSPATVSSFFGKYEVVRIRGNNVLVGPAAVEHLDKLRSDKHPKTPEVTETAAPVQPQPVGRESYLVNIDRQFTTSELVNFIERLGMFINGPEQTYHVTLNIREILK